MIEIYVDGACEPVNPGGIATYGFLVRVGGKLVESGSGVLEGGDTSNNVAEYTALIKAFSFLLEKGIRGEDVVVRSDSELMVNQVRGAYGVYAERVVPLHREAVRLLKELRRRGNRVEVAWVPREENTDADRLSHEAYERYCEEHPSVRQRYAGFLATEKQKAFLRKLGVECGEWISKRVASRLIDLKLKERREVLLNTETFR